MREDFSVEFSNIMVPSQVLSEKYKRKTFRPPKGCRTAINFDTVIFKKIKNYQRPYKMFSFHFQCVSGLFKLFYEYKEKCSASEKINRNCIVFANHCWGVLHFLLLNDANLGISHWFSNTI
jgi:hypothetical protein